MPQIQVIANLVDIPARNRDRCSTFNSGSDDGFFDAFCVIFRALPVVPELERQFFEPSSAHNCECSRAPAGLPIHD